jgi:hypothetical protein
MVAWHGFTWVFAIKVRHAFWNRVEAAYSSTIYCV